MRAVDLERDIDASCLKLLCQALQICEPGRGMALRTLLVAPQNAEHATQLARCLASSALDRAQALAGAPRLVVDRLLRRAGLQRDQADAVRDDVVKLARHPRSFVRRGGLSLFVALTRQACRDVLKRARPAAAVDEQARNPAGQHHKPPEQRLVGVLHEAPQHRHVDVVDRQRGEGQRKTHERIAPLAVGGDRVDRDQRRPVTARFTGASPVRAACAPMPAMTPAVDASGRLRRHASDSAVSKKADPLIAFGPPVLSPQTARAISKPNSPTQTSHCASATKIAATP